MTTAPIKHMALPKRPSVPSSSFRKYDPKTAPISTLRAPKGVTRIAGAKAYAAKLKTSPRPTMLSLTAERALTTIVDDAYVWICLPTKAGS